MGAVVLEEVQAAVSLIRATSRRKILTVMPLPASKYAVLLDYATLLHCREKALSWAYAMQFPDDLLQCARNTRAKRKRR